MPKKYINPEILRLRFTNGYDDYFPLWKIEMFIDDAPTADVEEVKHGEWVPLENNKFQCSECGNQAVSSNPSIDVARDLHYCWSCGAKMDRKANE